MTAKKRIMILGITGMLGSAVHKYFLETKKYNVYGTTRTNTTETINIIKLFVEEKGHIEEVIGWIRPDYVINCIGAIPQNKPEVLDYFNINFDFPSNIIKTKTILIQPSTDCIFSGKRLPGSRLYNFYSKQDERVENYSKEPYGISKRIFDEVYADDCIILRGSVLGPSFGKKGFGLFDWVEKQRNKEVMGFVNHLWNGNTTLEFAKVCEKIIDENNKQFGVYTLGNTEVNTKGNLIQKISDSFGYNIEVKDYIHEEFLDRTLAQSNLVKSFTEQLEELKDWYTGKQ